MSNYYTVWVTDKRYRGDQPLTYASESKLDLGSIIRVPFRQKTSLGLVVSSVDRPDFELKEVESVIAKAPLPPSQLSLLKWMVKYYPAPISVELQLFLPSSLSGTKDEDKKVPKLSKKKEVSLPNLTIEQSKAIKQIEQSKSRTILLHGETGSGKTRVYLELVRKALDQNLSAIVLTPEIGLTTQLVSSLRASFPDKVVLLHSAVNPKARRSRWHQVHDSKTPLIVVGPRSALFAPLKDVGLIVIDEAHEQAYKQEQQPRYQTTRVAAKLAELSHSKLILGSATPLISDYYMLSRLGEIVRMSGLAIKPKENTVIQPPVTIKLTDKDEFSRSRWLSNELLKSIEQSAKSGEQSMIFLNRRGTALTVLCNVCGWHAACPNCSNSLTYHGDSHSIRCHNCGFSSKVPTNCPVCRNHDVIFKGAGTKAIVEDLKKIFPMLSISRFDRDNKKSESLSENYKHLLSGKIDIAVGTQILTKGFDLPKLSTVGVIAADSSLAFPDYTAEERTYQLLAQVIGRVSRGHTAGRVFLQAYNPNNPAISLATRDRYLDFYEEQIKQRSIFKFPPFYYLLKISTERASSKSSQDAIAELTAKIKLDSSSLIVSEPMPAFREKIRGKFIWQIVVKAKERSALLKVIEKLPQGWSYDIDPSNLL
ncbi:MAG TPA: primosomal protein N' [Candidatus Saccharimonadales bacterium]|nr:primosomal protein N' [Candidatus Saccharimonadales bacterium]